MPANPERSSQVLAHYLEPETQSQLRKADPGLEAQITRDLESFDEEGTAELVDRILGTLNRDDEEITQDERDAALELLKRVDLSRAPRQALLDSYFKAVSQMPVEADTYGPKDALLEAGVMIAPQLPNTPIVRDRITEAWEAHVMPRAGLRRNADEIWYVLDRKSQIIKELQPATEENSKLGNRDQPPMSNEIRELHDKYLETVKRDGQFKLALWDNTPEFRELCGRYGVRLEDFWNLRDSDRVANEVAVLQTSNQISEQAREAFARSVKTLTGVELSQLDKGTARILADQMVEAARMAQKELTSKIDTSFDRKIEGFHAQIAEAEELMQTDPRVKKMLGPVKGFFTALGFNASEATLAQLKDSLNNPALITEFRGYFEQRNNGRLQAIDELEALFNPKKYDNGFTLMARTRDDMFLGDLTGDCTAYHLNTGVNGWTVPTWLSNPGFNFFKIDDGRTAKMGILLAVADGQPVLVVDSIEVGSAITDQEEAKKRIHAGFAYLQSWAEAIGLRVQLMSNISNSSELGNIMSQELTTESEYAKVEALGGLSGLSELRRNLTGKTAKETTYLQSAPHEFDDDDDRLNEGDSRLLRMFEDRISDTLQRMNKYEAPELEKLLREGNWAEAFTYLAQVNFGTVTSVLGNRWESMQRLMSDEGRREYIREIVKRYDLDHVNAEDVDTPFLEAIMMEYVDKEISKILAEEMGNEWHYMDIDDQDKLKQKRLAGDTREEDAKSYYEFMDMLSDMYEGQLTPEQAIRRLYGVKDIADELELPLYRYMSRLKQLQ
jgi:hypothetical protein